MLKTQCLKVCPKGGVTVLTQAQVGLGRFAILQTGADIDALYEECKADEPGQSLQLMQPGIREAGEGKKNGRPGRSAVVFPQW